MANSPLPESVLHFADSLLAGDEVDGRERSADIVAANDFGRLAAELFQSGLPVNYVQRVVAELRDHQRDIEESEGAARSLGELSVLKDTIVESYRQQSFAGRRPMTVFVLGSFFAAPLLALAYAVFVVIVCVGIFPACGFDLVYDMKSEWAHIAVYGAVYCGAILPYLIPAVWLSRAAQRAGRGRCWLLVSVVLQIFVALATTVSFHIESGAPGESEIGVVFCSEKVSPAMTAWRIACQALIPMVVSIPAWLRRANTFPPKESVDTLSQEGSLL